MFRPYTDCGFETFRRPRRWGMSPVSEKLSPQHMCRMHGRRWLAVPHLRPTCCADGGATPGHSRCVGSGCQGLEMGRLSRAAHGWYGQCIPRHAGASLIAACLHISHKHVKTTSAQDKKTPQNSIFFTQIYILPWKHTPGHHWGWDTRLGRPLPKFAAFYLMNTNAKQNFFLVCVFINDSFFQINGRN